MFLYSGECLTS